MAPVPEKSGAGFQWYCAAVVVLTLALYVASCLLPATDIGSWGEERGPDPGWAHLLLGWVSGLKGLPAWSANFVLWAAVVCLPCSRFRAAAVLGIAAALLGLTTLTSFRSNSLYSGYYLWQSSQILFAVGASVAYGWSRLGRVLAEPDTVAESRPRERL